MKNNLITSFFTKHGLVFFLLEFFFNVLIIYCKKYSQAQKWQSYFQDFFQAQLLHHPPMLPQHCPQYCRTSLAIPWHQIGLAWQQAEDEITNENKYLLLWEDQGVFLAPLEKHINSLWPSLKPWSQCDIHTYLLWT